jgi:hypothetical protein
MWTLAACLAVTSAACATDPPTAPAVAQALDAIEAGRERLTSAYRKAAQRMGAAGDLAYRKHEYRAAFHAYANAYPNYPNAYAYIMAGDAHWRAVLEHQQRQAARTPSACALDNSRFSRDLDADLTRHHELGLALAERDNDRRLLKSTIYRRAQESATCLRALARRYEAQPPSACVDLDQLRDCLGSPLMH